MSPREQILALAKKHWHRDQWNNEYFDAEAFYHAAIQQYKDSLLKEVKGHISRLIAGGNADCNHAVVDGMDFGLEPLVTKSQHLAQLAKAEQRVAEACAEAVRSGEWRKFLKEGG